jgi:cytochrome c-type biogenesis protein
MREVGIPLAFIAGIVSFASPCCLPLVPGYVSYMLATSPERSAASRRVALLHALAFVAGFSLVFVAIWASVGLIGYLFRDYAGLLRQLGGAVLVFMGLHVAGAIDVAALYREKRLPMGAGASLGGVSSGGAGSGDTHDHGRADASSARRYGRSALLGVVFSAGWTPCIGPILGGIIGLASVSASVGQGVVLLLVYALGLGIPFVLVALGVREVSDRLGSLRRHEILVGVVTGAMLAAVGFLMIANAFGRLSGALPLVEV